MLWLARWLGLAAFYLLFIDAVPVEERYAAAIAGGVGILSFAVLQRRNQRHAFRASWLIRFCRLVPGIAVDTYRVLIAHPLAALAKRGPAGGRFIALPFDPGSEDPISAGRRVAVLFGNSLTPNAVPIFIDEQRRLLVLHQLHPVRESGAGDREWPM
ncbi:MAG TPA: hypothetical protein VJ779_21365 [Acetobacteraceae bacterium]|nr:hypothetical protein [Acetobacteraceae bacterium]